MTLFREVESLDDTAETVVHQVSMELGCGVPEIDEHSAQ